MIQHVLYSTMKLKICKISSCLIYRRQVIPPGTPVGRPLLSQIARTLAMAEAAATGVAVYWLILQSVDSNEELKNRSEPPMIGMATPLFTGFTNPGW